MLDVDVTTFKHTIKQLEEYLVPPGAKISQILTY
jgi:hypothetical protein